jgi:hypothetical protein
VDRCVVSAGAGLAHLLAKPGRFRRAAQSPMGAAARNYGWPDSLAAADPSGEWIGHRLRLRRTGATDGSHRGDARAQRDLDSTHVGGCEIYRLSRSVHSREGSSYAGCSCRRSRLGCVACAVRANKDAVSKARACQLESDRSSGQGTFHVDGASEAASIKREIFPA